MLQGEPNERVTIPEIFNHVWIRTPTNMSFLEQSHQTPATTTSTATNIPIPSAAPSSVTVTSIGGGDNNGRVISSATPIRDLDELIPLELSISKVPYRPTDRLHLCIKIYSIFC